MLRRLIIFAFILFCSIPALAIDAALAHTIFYSTKLTPNLNIYWQINPNTLHYITNAEKKILARVKTDIILSNDTGIITHDQYIMQTVPRAGLNEITQYPIIELRNYELPTGIVKIKVTLTDMSDTTNRFMFKDSVSIALPANTTFYSGIQFIDTMFESTTRTKFSKSGKQVIPFCANFFDDGMNRLRYYAELYNTDKVTKTDYPLIQIAAISKNELSGHYGNLQQIDTIKTGQSLYTTTGGFDLASLPSGNYYMRATLQNSQKDILASSTLFFQKLNKHPYTAPTDTTKKNTPVSDTGIESVTVLNLNKTFLAKYDLGQIRAILKMLLPVSDPIGRQSINSFLKKPDEMYMRYYIYNYFSNINKKDPTRAWKEFSAKIADVNKRFNTHSTPGYETERGYIYLRYGAPTDIITVENEQGTQPYEIWQYNALTQMNHKDIADVIFLFYKPNQMLDDYKLLHSNVSGEMQNQQWRSTLYMDTQSGNYNDSRAEQYIGNK